MMCSVVVISSGRMSFCLYRKRDILCGSDFRRGGSSYSTVNWCL